MNQMTFEKLQYNELKEIIQSSCVSELGRKLVDQLQPSSNLTVVKNRLNETTEARAVLDAEGHIPFTGTLNIGHIIKSLEKGQMLTPEDLVAISDFLRGCRRLKTFMFRQSFFAPILSSYANSMSTFQAIEEEINFSIKGNQIDSAASKELKKIRRNIGIHEDKIKERLNKFLTNRTNKDYIQEFFISKKDNRFTIPIKASYKNQIDGSIIEVSGKGSTVFMEPNSITKLNTELAMLKAEEAIEEYQILATLTGSVLEKLQSINVNMELIGQYDLVFAKAQFSKKIDGIAPMINEHGFTKLVQCKHPLLQEDAVPLDFEIGNDYRGLVITGPNAGGKTIVLKTIGLLTLATMSGIHIAAEQGTEIALFEKIFVDIGDNQSIENALSTFSSHMKNLSEIMSNANNHTLLLFDEIGSGTEPNEGAALAIAILEEFYHMGCITVATTHYGEIKRFSEIHPDFMNAAMQFDNETLTPLYQLVIGKSGESNALWISRKMKIEEKILRKAKNYMENKDYDFAFVNNDQIRKPAQINQDVEQIYAYEKGDRVRLLDHNDIGIVFEDIDPFNKLIYFKGEFVKVPIKRIRLEGAARDLYPEGYDLDTLFTDFRTRKMNHDIQRGSKKVLRAIDKEIRRNKDRNGL